MGIILNQGEDAGLFVETRIEVLFDAIIKGEKNSEMGEIWRYLGYNS